MDILYDDWRKYGIFICVQINSGTVNKSLKIADYAIYIFGLYILMLQRNNRSEADSLFFMDSELYSCRYGGGCYYVAA